MIQDLDSQRPTRYSCALHGCSKEARTVSERDETKHIESQTDVIILILAAKAATLWGCSCKKYFSLTCLVFQC